MHGREHLLDRMYRGFVTKTVGELFQARGGGGGYGGAGGGGGWGVGAAAGGGVGGVGIVPLHGDGPYAPRQGPAHGGRGPGGRGAPSRFPPNGPNGPNVPNVPGGPGGPGIWDGTSPALDVLPPSVVAYLPTEKKVLLVEDKVPAPI